ncbi:MAG: NADH-quinone oxidoreductase subunit J [Pseudomonadota bacterium]|jgi:NADH-quinone oxidoreductase subunit J|nr:NADH-quinone oxidoreductase subunit J [Pseudomonadota bacterium]QKK05208.1 MAG: NADH-quinone oxidoreductase subunit J [Pseudomonadota bacterium]
MIEALVFYMFASVLIASGVMVITARNSVHSVLFLILAFFNAAGLFVLLGAEFVAMILVIVYVGAVAVLFLFVVMMLDVGRVNIKEGLVSYLPIGGLVGLVLLAELVWLYWTWEFSAGAVQNRLAPMSTDAGVTNTHALGQILYTQNVYLFQTAGLILLVSMIGAIVLTLRTRPGVRKQKVSDQVSRRPADAMEIQQVETGAGVQ